MATITAKFSSKCASYGCQRGGVQAGETVNYERGLGVWHLTCDPKSVRKLTPYTAEERAFMAEQIAEVESELEAEELTEWTKEVTIGRRAQVNAAGIRRSDIDMDGFCELVGFNINELKQAIVRHGL